MKVRKSNSESKIVLLPNLWKYVCKSIKIYKRGGEIVAEDQSKVFEAAQENMKKTVETDAMLISNAQQRVQVSPEDYIRNIGESIGKEYTIVSAWDGKLTARCVQF